MGVSLKRIRTIAQGIFFVMIGGAFLFFGVLFLIQWPVEGVPEGADTVGQLLFMILLAACGPVAMFGGIAVILSCRRKSPQ
jgi:membrane protease YdiL (CAAX protease family)